MPKPKVCVLRAAGTNCDAETVYACERAGALPERVHVNRLIENPDRLGQYQMLIIPGGFTYGDDISAGKVLAVQLANTLTEVLGEFVAADKLIVGICNGFQVLAKMGLLPGGEIGGEQDVTLSANDSNRFEDRWVTLRAESSRSVFIKEGQVLYLPVAHAEGKFVPRDGVILRRMQVAGQVIFRYVSANGGKPEYPDNPNGSVDDVAGICDTSGHILGMMPHPERHVEPWHHPQWTRKGMTPEGDGLQIFRNAVQYFA
ncbi:unnamed protein product [marine sediment metagenome]|uniref:Uncharacterized protein n=1 Tax=marine sediment metagenome TaxID=412755 RepID=X1GS79_9ZZZZ